MLEGQAQGVLVGHTEGVVHVDAKGDGRSFISNSKDQSIKLWDLRCMRSEAQARAVHKPSQLSYKWCATWAALLAGLLVDLMWGLSPSGCHGLAASSVCWLAAGCWLPV